MQTEIKVRKPRDIRFFGIGYLYERYYRRQAKWANSFPKNGDKIRITWLPSCRNAPAGTPNPYIGMEGIVEKLTITGDFHLNCGSCYLVCPYNDFNYIKL